MSELASTLNGPAAGVAARLLRDAKRAGAAAAFAMLSACASLPGFGGGDEAPSAAAVEAETARTQIASLEAEVAKLKSQNARLSNEVLALQRERDRQANADPVALPPAPEVLTEQPAPKSNAVVDDAASPALAKTGVPVQQAPRLVQPAFASDETVFENEAEGDIATESVLFGVHLASYRHEAEARAGWRQLQRDNPDELGLLEPRVEPVTVEGKGDFLRLVGGGFASREKADALCGQLKSKGLYCSVTSFEGQRLSLAETTH
ncbi:MAG: SPOR domain-containing protein [Parvularculaceae bacterium]